MKQRAKMAWTATLALLVAASGLGANETEKVDYEKQIKPIFQNNCVKCHGAKKRKGRLRLDAPDLITQGGKEGKTVVPGDAANSNMVKRITLTAATDTEDEMMPPALDANDNPVARLKASEIALIKQWISEGASFGSSRRSAVKGSTEPMLPKVPKADAEAIAKIEKLGAHILPLATTTNLLNVDFRAVADKTTDEHLELLKPLSGQIAWLNLGATKVSDRGLAKIASLKQLRRLYLDRSTIGDSGLAHLKGFPELYYLNLYGSKVTDKGLAHLGGLSKLRKLFVWQTGVTREGASSFARGKKIEINTGWVAPPEPKPTPKPVAKKTINAKCPFTGKALNASATFEFQGQTIGFCCNNCLGKFKKNPKAHIGKVKEFKLAKTSKGPINSKCPFTNKAINPGATFVYQGKTIAFCCNNCLGKFRKNPKAHIGKVKEFKDPATSALDAEGFVRVWLVLAPIPCESEFSGAVEIDQQQIDREGSLRPKAGQKVKVRGKELAWTAHRPKDYYVDFRESFGGAVGGEDTIAYAVAYVSAPTEMKGLTLRIGSNDQAKVYLNGRQILVFTETRGLEKDQNSAGVTLRKGENVVVFKVINEKNNWQGCLRFTRGDSPVTDISISTEPSDKTSKGPINTKCPFTNKAVNPRATFVYQGKTIAFCCNNCLGKFKRNPKAHIAKVKEFKK